ncbi:thiamine pyrophosphate-dependent enzyme [Rathayibacter toxicus]|uniref:thiamine pyrophosphate-dependent enzyme n=1 Tax=Rathayibacter toxicus TaxID=145458 RepID=UPI001C059CAC|nr:thiamine pyrophosphate-dependent enzyme [Rathayibacter toxicus]QWL33044.1 phosphonopyruvate decarboxylase [Rathayibacter toxicus]QWL35138.1 phosphonopyruvate decarboxylase [Rathayibacter toxicus]QWL37269.1 phosphonopyruvate decarboxylase [Rathayibacter toxicus]QWL39361.1 phosphonopyruvate decarboxylase [Rathayibacter toxicus]QWL41447.1 phosphonopyruvate decarboxylase [Rathayibacter toxicus]
MLDPRDAITDLASRFPESIFVSTCGFITRDLLAVADRPKNFYLVGSMGMALPVAVGIAMTRPHDHLVVLDGDGSFAMNLGASALMGNHRLRITHAVLDNGRHESTGGQHTVGIADFRALGYGLGYDDVREIDVLPDPHKIGASGSTLVRYLCGTRSAGAGPRLELAPEQLAARFRAAISTEAAA